VPSGQLRLRARLAGDIASVVEQLTEGSLREAAFDARHNRLI
jgi:hypothetical protein